MSGRPARHGCHHGKPATHFSEKEVDPRGLRRLIPCYFS